MCSDLSERASRCAVILGIVLVLTNCTLTPVSAQSITPTLDGAEAASWCQASTPCNPDDFVVDTDGHGVTYSPVKNTGCKNIDVPVGVYFSSPMGMQATFVVELAFVSIFCLDKGVHFRKVSITPSAPLIPLPIV